MCRASQAWLCDPKAAKTLLLKRCRIRRNTSKKQEVSQNRINAAATTATTPAKLPPRTRSAALLVGNAEAAVVVVCTRLVLGLPVPWPYADEVALLHWNTSLPPPPPTDGSGRVVDVDVDVDVEAELGLATIAVPVTCCTPGTESVLGATKVSTTGLEQGTRTMTSVMTWTVMAPDEGKAVAVLEADAEADEELAGAVMLAVAGQTVVKRSMVCVTMISF